MNTKQNFELIVNKLDISDFTKKFILMDNNQKKITKYNKIVNCLIEISEIIDIKYFNIIISNSLTKSILVIYDNIYIYLKNFIKNIYENCISFIEEKKLKKYILTTLNVFKKHYPNNINKIDIKQNGLKRSMWTIKIDIDDYNEIQNNKNNNIYYSPNKWVYISEKNVYLESNLNKTLLSNGKFIQDNHIHSLYNQNIVDIINDLQKIPHKLDINLFNSLFSNNNLILFYIKKDKYNIYINNYYNYINDNINKYFMYRKYDDKIKFFSYVDKKCINKNENNIFNISPSEKLVLNFIYNHQDLDIYNILVCDYRGRLYIQNSISYISSKLYRLITTLKNYNFININSYYKYYLTSQITNVKSFSDAENIYNNIDNIKNYKNKILFEKIYLHKNQTISLDATASMLQIIALITKNYKLMKYTNLIPNIDKIDIYDEIKKILNIKYKDSIFIEYYNNRNLIKYSIMLYIYNSSPLYTAAKLIDEFNFHSILKSDLTSIINNITKTFKEEFNAVVILKKIINLFIKKYNDNTFIINSILKKIEYSCPKSKRIKINFENINIDFQIESELQDNKKIKRSCFPNIIHSLDSEICLITRHNLYKSNIHSLSIHDCFIININDYEILLKEYNKSLMEIYKIDILYILPQLNDLIKNDEILKNEIQYLINSISDYNNINNYNTLNCFYTLKPE